MATKISFKQTLREEKQIKLENLAILKCQAKTFLPVLF